MDKAARRFMRDLIRRERLRPHVEAALVRLDDRLRERLRSPSPPPTKPRPNRRTKMTETPKTVFVTKYALTGKCEIPEREVVSIENGYAYVSGPGAPSYGYSVGRDYALTREDAIKQAEAMKLRKLASLRNQIAKLEAMTFA